MDLCCLRKLIFLLCALMLATLLYYAYSTRVVVLKLVGTAPTDTPLCNNCSRTSRPNLSSLSALVADHGTETSPIATNLSEQYVDSLVEHIWPRANVTKTEDRIINQIDFIDEFWTNKFNATSKPHPLKPDQIKVILKYGDFNFNNLKEGQSYFVRDGCPINSCTITGNMSVRFTADALIFSEFSWGSRTKFLPKPLHQIWIAQHWESPKHNHIDPNALKGLVNWTATYRRDSTIPFGYGYFAPIDNSTPSTANYVSGKIKRVAWLVGNCYPSNHRNYYVRELSRYIDVDVYGYCGTKRCPAKGSCLQWIGDQYKFYLAFENSNCKDYITEKLFRNSLSYNILPVVLGARREDYLAAAPPMSYIHVDDFPTPRELAAYLFYLDKNDTAYNAYFAWKGTMLNINQKYWCRICTMLHQQQRDGYVHWYDDYTTWWNGVCTAGSNRLRSKYFMSSACSGTLVFIVIVSSRLSIFL